MVFFALKYVRKFFVCYLLVIINTNVSPARTEPSLEVKSIPKNIIYNTNKTNKKLKLLAGYSLTSSDPRFGGISSIQIRKDGKFLWAISDRGYWMRFSLIHQSENLANIHLNEIKILQVPRGEKREIHNLDAEASTLINSQTLLVSFENTNRILAYQFKDDIITGVPRYYKSPEALADAPRTGGPEAMARLCDGRVFLLNEKNNFGRHLRVGWVGNEKTWQMVRYQPYANYDPTGATTLPDCRVMLTVRRFNLTSFSWGIAFIDFSKIGYSNVIHDTSLVLFNRSAISENFEAIAARVGRNGKIYVYAMADDNFSIFQETLLLQFELEPVSNLQ